MQDEVRSTGATGNLTQRSRLHVSQDDDGDGIAAAADNCAAVWNHDQADADVDGQGDACDANDDNDLHEDAADNARPIRTTCSATRTTTAGATRATERSTPTRA